MYRFLAKIMLVIILDIVFRLVISCKILLDISKLQDNKLKKLIFLKITLLYLIFFVKVPKSLF